MYILRKIAEGFPNSRIDDLLPWNWKRGSGYRFEKGFLPDGAYIDTPGFERYGFRLAALGEPFEGVRQGTVSMWLGDIGMRVRTDIEAATLIYPADVDIQLPGFDEWFRAGTIRRMPNDELVCELRLYGAEPIRFRLIREKDGRHTSSAKRGDLLAAD